MKILLFMLAVVIWLIHCEVVNSAPPRNEPDKIIYITASWCGPCQTFKAVEIPKLVAKGYKVNKTATATIRIIDWDDDKVLLDTYKLKAFNSIPKFIYIRNNIEVDRIHFKGVVTAEDVRELYKRNRR